MSGDVARADATFERGLAARRRWQGDVDLLAFGEDPELTCGIYLSWTKTARGLVDTGLQHVDVAVASARKSSHPISIAFAETFRVVALGWSGEFERAQPMADSLEHFCVEHRLVFWAASARMYRGWAMAHLGDAESGLVLMREGLAQWRQTGAGLHVPTFETVIAEGCLLSGRHDEARRARDNALRACRLHGENLHLGTILRLEALDAAHTGDVERAIALFEQSIDQSDRNGAGLFELRAALDAALLLRSLGRDHNAIETLARSMAKVDAGSDVSIISEAERLRGSLCGASAD
jgi:predicted ATPase